MKKPTSHHSTTGVAVRFRTIHPHPNLHPRSARVAVQTRMNEPTTTSPDYMNRNRQRVVRATDLPGTDHGQRVYVLHCEHCGTDYGANGSDIHHRLCPTCQGGRPGLRTE